MAPPRLEELIVKARDPNTELAEFRQALKNIGTCLAYEVDRSLETTTTRVTTVMGREAIQYPAAEKPVLVAILRAGLPLYHGAQSVFPDSESGVIGSMRDEKTLQPNTTYVALPDLTNKIAIIFDTMLATGGSMCDAIKIVQERGAKEVYVCSAIAAIKGIERVASLVPRDHIFAAAIDDELNDKGYIVPGLGDAGDRSFGKKVD